MRSHLNIKHTALLVLPLVFSAACTREALNLNPLTQLSEGSYYNNKLELKQAVDHVYHQLGRLANAGSVADLYGESYSDNTVVLMTSGDVNGAADETISNFSVRANNSRILTAWDETYNAIFICNNVLHQLAITSLEIDETEKKRWISEAHVVRSIAYFNLVRVFGAVPLVLQRISHTEAYDYLRESPDVVYERIIADLRDAKVNLPASYTGTDLGRITRHGASAVLAKIHLTRGDKQEARAELESIIDSRQFSLDANGDGTINVDDFRHLFLPATKNCKESVLEAQYMAGVNAFNSNHQNRYTPFHHPFNLPGVPGNFRGSGVNTPSDNLIDEFEAADPRRAISIMTGYTDQTSGNFVEYPYTFKFFDPNWQNPGQNFEIIRFADILLMYAEVTEDPQYLNQVRERVGLPAFGSEGYPATRYPTLALAIEHERRVELTHEMHRMFDLVRTGRAIDVLGSKGVSIGANALVFPIPENAIDVNPRLTQNTGY